MSRLTNKDDRGRYYTVEEKILIANEPVNPTTTWIVHNENRRYGSPIEKLGELEDLEEQLGCPLEVVITPYFKRGKLEVFYRGKMREVIRVVAFEQATRPYMDVFYRDNEKEQFKVKTIWLDDYKKTWWLKKDKSE